MSKAKKSEDYFNFEPLVDLSEIDTTPLDLDDDFYDVLKEVLPVAAKWKAVGQALRLKAGELDSIAASHPRNPEACLSEILTQWLRKNYNVKRFGEPTWQRLVEIVADPPGGANPALANQIAEKHKLKGKMKHSTGFQRRHSFSHRGKVCWQNIEDPYAQPYMEPDDLVQDVMTQSKSQMRSSWYHGKISRQDTEEKLENAPDGYFLIRESATQPDNFALSLKHQGMVIHRIIEFRDDSYTYEIQGARKRFKKLTQLVKYYTAKYISTQGEILITPCPQNMQSLLHQSAKWGNEDTPPPVPVILQPSPPLSPPLNTAAELALDQQPPFNSITQEETLIEPAGMGSVETKQQPLAQPTSRPTEDISPTSRPTEDSSPTSRPTEDISPSSIHTPLQKQTVTKSSSPIEQNDSVMTHTKAGPVPLQMSPPNTEEVHVDYTKPIPNQETRPTSVDQVDPSLTPSVDQVDPSLTPSVDQVDPSLTPSVDQVDPSLTPSSSQVDPSLTPSSSQPISPLTPTEQSPNSATTSLQPLQRKRTFQCCSSPEQMTDVKIETVTESGSDHEACTVTGEGISTAVVHSATSFMLHIPASLTATKCTVASEMTHVLDHSVTKCTVTQKGEREYEIFYKPQVRGRHELSVKVGAQEIQGSPFTVFVHYPVHMLGLPVRTIPAAYLPQLSQPIGLAFDKMQPHNIIVCESGKKRVSVLSREGRKIKEIPVQGPPHGVAVDKDEYMYVTIPELHQIQKLSKDGALVKAVGGLQVSMLKKPQGIRVSPSDGRLYVCDSGNSEVKILDTELKFVSSFGQKGRVPGSLMSPADIAFDNTGDIYVADRDRNRVVQFSPISHEYVKEFGKEKRAGLKLKLNRPKGICVCLNSDIVYVTDCDHCVNVFQTSGKLISTFGGRGHGSGHFQYPTGIAVDEDGFVHVCDRSNNCIQIF